jgi:hypothetical protein
MDEEGIKFVSDIFKELVIIGHSCSCTYITEDMLIIAKMIIVQV